MSLDRSHLDAASGGAFFSLSVADAKTLMMDKGPRGSPWEFYSDGP